MKEGETGWVKHSWKQLSGGEVNEGEDNLMQGYKNAKQSIRDSKHTQTKPRGMQHCAEVLIHPLISVFCYENGKSVEQFIETWEHKWKWLPRCFAYGCRHWLFLTSSVHINNDFEPHSTTPVATYFQSSSWLIWHTWPFYPRSLS